MPGLMVYSVCFICKLGFIQAPEQKAVIADLINESHHRHFCFLLKSYIAVLQFQMNVAEKLELGALLKACVSGSYLLACGISLCHCCAVSALFFFQRSFVSHTT